MATKQFQQTDTDPGATCPIATACTGKSVTAGTSGTRRAIPAGSTGVTSVSLSIPSSETGRLAACFDCLTDAAFYIAPGTAEVKLNVDSIGANTPTLKEIWICKVDGACASISVIGSLTGLTTGLSVTTLTHNVTVVGTAIGLTDHILVLYALDNTSSMAAATATFLPDQIITFTEGVQPNNGSASSMWVLGLLGG